MNPFLFTLQREDWALFDLATGLSSVAIRDQMVRAMMLADELPEWLQQEHGAGFMEWPILVIGAGACGMTAAAALARQGFRVLTIDRSNRPFSVQRNCTSRWVSPTQYDWPLDHWRRERFRWSAAHRRPPFAWQAALSSQIVRNQWIPKFRAHRRAVGPLLQFQGDVEADLNTLAVDPNQPKLLQLVIRDLQTGHQAQYGPFGAIILATGFRPETAVLPGNPQFVGHKFWSTDTFEAVACGVPIGQAQEGTVLISGTGDGALQDFLRIVTRRRSVRQIFDALGLGAVAFAVEEIASADQRAERALNWCRTRRDPFAVAYLDELHQTHQRVVQTLTANAALQMAVPGVVQGRPQRTILVSRSQTFACTYALNRFLTLLLLALIQDGTVELLSGHEVEQIQSHPGHAPPAPPNAQNCLGHPWRVTLLDLNANHPVTIDANVIILRHGGAVAPAQLLHDGPRPVPPTHAY
jgi:Pyridine nucleotide-disulphide oxidoreductase